jgi:NTP pyrophosphatase (non-canonical NTP hydrolase)
MVACLIIYVLNVITNGGEFIIMSDDYMLKYLTENAIRTEKRFDELDAQLKELVNAQTPIISDRVRASMQENTFGIPTYLIDKCNSLVTQEDQLDILQEECAELIQACSKVLRDKSNSFASLKEEMAHVLMSSAMVANILGITQEDIDLEVEKKTNKFFSASYIREKKVDREILFEKYKERARIAYETK